MKIAINGCFGGFSLSPKAVELYWMKKEGKKLYWFVTKPGNYDKYIPTNDPGSGFLAFGSFTEEFDKKNFVSAHMDVERNDPILIEVIEELKEVANGSHAELKVVEIPDDVEWVIEEYDGVEWIAEKHRTWS